MHAAFFTGSRVKKITLVGLLAATTMAGAQGKEGPAEIRTAAFPAELDRYIADVLVKGGIPGIGLAIVRDDSVVVAKGYGVRELGKPDPVDANTVFDIASLAKSFTATMVARLVDRGVVHWDAPVSRYLKDVALPTPELTAAATLRDFLSHRSGLEAANMMWVPSAITRDEVLRRSRFLKVVAPLRQQMIYSNVGYTIAGEAAARAAGTTYEELIRNLLIGPLRLRSTTATYEQTAHMPNVSSSHATVAGRLQVLPRERQRHSIGPAGGVQSTMADLTRWMRLHLNRGVLDGVRYLSDSAVSELYRIQIVIPTTPEMRAAREVRDSAAYGLGFQIMDYKGHPLLWHSGNGNGQIAYMVLLPRDRLGIAVVVNTWSVPLIHGALVSRIMDHYLGYPPRDWAAENLAAVPRSVAVQDSMVRALESGATSGPPPRALSAYAGRYEEPLFGPIVVREEGAGLTLQMGEGQLADLTYHHGESFVVRWRVPFFREYFLTMGDFSHGSGETGASLHMLLNRDHITAVRRP